MHMSLITAELMLKERHKDLMAEAQKHWMIRRARESQVTQASLWRIKLGDFLIRAGFWIKGRSTSNTRPLPCR